MTKDVVGKYRLGLHCLIRCPGACIVEQMRNIGSEKGAIKYGAIANRITAADPAKKKRARINDSYIHQSSSLLSHRPKLAKEPSKSLPYLLYYSLDPLTQKLLSTSRIGEASLA
jgi:hypothetical protein